MIDRRSAAIRTVQSMHDGVSSIIDASAVVSDAAGSRGSTGRPVTDTRTAPADAERAMKHSSSIVEGLRPVGSGKYEPEAALRLLKDSPRFLGPQLQQTSMIRKPQPYHELQHQPETSEWGVC